MPFRWCVIVAMRLRSDSRWGEGAMRNTRLVWLALATTLGLTACSGGSNSMSNAGTSPPAPQSTSDSGCSGFCANASSFLTEDDVRKVIAQAVNEAAAQGKPSVIAVVDRVGNVLGVYHMAGA